MPLRFILCFLKRGRWAKRSFHESCEDEAEDEASAEGESDVDDEAAEGAACDDDHSPVVPWCRSAAVRATEDGAEDVRPAAIEEDGS